MELPHGNIKFKLVSALAVILLIALTGAILIRGAGEKYEVKGVVREIRPGAQKVVIDHEEIPGYMAAMTMPFEVESSEVLDTLEAGDIVRFDLLVQETDSHAENFEIIGKEKTQTAAGSAQRKQSLKYETGDSVVPTTLTDEQGDPVQLESPNDRYTVGTFIFTRCPLPEFCPLMATRFHQLQDKILSSPELENRVRLLSITLDPEYDRPDVLAGYGESQGADSEVWNFATGAPEKIEKLARDFRVYREKNGATLDHALCTFLLSPEGHILEIWRGNRWEVTEVMATIRDAEDSGEQSLAENAE